MHVNRFRARGLRVRTLEPRLMLSVAPSPVESYSALSFPLSEITTPVGELVEEAQPSPVGSSSSERLAPLPAIPFDDAISPLTEVPDLESTIRMPGDANADGTIDFMDFLLLRQNYGSENATWEQGDFNADGRVGFEDLLLLSSRY